VALVLGTLIALSRRCEYFLYPFILMFQAMPKVALAPLIIIWFGLGLSSKVAQAGLTAFFPLMVNTIAGLRSADEDRIALMRSLDASEIQIFRMLRMPGAMPFIFAGFEIAMMLSLIGAIVAEFVGAQKGLGVLLLSMTFTMDAAGQFSVLFVLSLLGLLLHTIIVIIRKRLLFWDMSQDRIPDVPAEGKV
jgi:NitT/TauT family transport system permease protein